LKVKIQTLNAEIFYVPNKTFQDVFFEVDSIKKSSSGGFYVYQESETKNYAIDVNSIVSITEHQELQPNIRMFDHDDDDY